MEKYIIVSCPTTELSYTNKAILNPQDNLAKFEHIAVRYPRKNEAFVYSIKPDASVSRGQIAFNLSGRKWASLSTNTEIEAAPYKFEPKEQILTSITFYTDFASVKNAPANVEFDTGDMAKQFSMEFVNQAFTVGQIFGFAYLFNNRRVILELKVKDLQAVNMQESGTSSVEIGLTTANTIFMFERAEGSEIRLTGAMTGMVATPQIFSGKLDFSELGIGGLSEQFRHIFRRAFVTRLIPPYFAEGWGVNHVQGMLLHGPPGTGKTLIARQIGKMLLSREPKVVNGPEILNKYVGESEANIRKLFAEAEEEQAKLGINSGLHVIIFDEIDSICKTRGNSASSSGVGDNVVNQLLTKIDGVNALRNVLLIGMTNRRDLIDEALLRPGRLEVQVEIGLPNKEGRLEILKIHTMKLSKAGALQNVDLDVLATKAKNYTGAELAGLVKSATSFALEKVIEPGSEIEVTKEVLDSVKVTMDDFLKALEEVKPALGAADETIKELVEPIYYWDPRIEEIMMNSRKAIETTLRMTHGTNTVLFVGERTSELISLAATIAQESKFPFIKVLLAKDTSKETESGAIQRVDKIFQDANKSELSCILFNDIETILRYCYIGPRFSDSLRSTFVQNLNYTQSSVNCKRLIICTCSDDRAIKDLELEDLFDTILRVPSLTSPEHVTSLLSCMEQQGITTLDRQQREELASALGCISFKMGAKKVQAISRSIMLEDPSQRAKEFVKKMHSLNLIQKGTRLDQFF